MNTAAWVLLGICVFQALTIVGIVALICLSLGHAARRGDEMMERVLADLKAQDEAEYGGPFTPQEIIRREAADAQRDLERRRRES